MKIMMKFPAGLLCWIIAFLLYAPFSHGQSKAKMVVDFPEKLSPHVPLPSKMNETSGLIYFDNAFWTFNDSGGKPEIYKIDPKDGKIVQTLILQGADNRDWEDISQDEDYIYVGDFGNNWGNRQDLKIYKVARKNITSDAKVLIPVETIHYSYSDQHAFKDLNRSNDFDCESLVSYGDSLLLFSKNWVTGNTRMYKVSKEPGTYSIGPVAEFGAEGLVTAADYCKESQRLVLLGYTNKVPFVCFFPDFDGHTLDAASAYRVNLIGMKNLQTEGICFVKKGRLAISAERTKKADQALYFAEIKELLSTGQH